jgi:molybdopterin synthase sulfur carrier subunit
MIRIVIPTHLRTLAKADREVTLEIEGEVTIRAVLDALEARCPMLKGTIRDHVTLKRRDFIRFFACGEDYSHANIDDPLPDPVAKGVEPFRIVGAMAGG